MRIGIEAEDARGEQIPRQQDVQVHGSMQLR